MFCPFCGESIQENAKFCGECGKPIPSKDEYEAEKTKSKESFLGRVNGNNSGKGVDGYVSEGIAAGEVTPGNNLGNKKKKINKKIIAVICALLAVCIGVGVYFYIQPSKIDVDKYVKVEFEGYDTIGTGYAHFDSALKARVKAKAKNVKQEGLNLFGDDDPYEEIMDCVQVKLSKEENLKNGEKITLYYEFNNKVAEDYDIEFVGDKRIIEVKGLDKITEVDPFKDVTLEYIGVSPSMTAEVKNNSKNEYIQDLDFEIDPNYGIKKGDTINVTVTNGDSYLEDYGIKLTKFEQKYKVGKAAEFVTKFNQIDDTTLKNMRTEASNYISDYAKEYSNEFIVKNVKYAGNYFFIKKEYSEHDYNYIDLVFTATVSQSPDDDWYDFKKQKVYFVVEYRDIVKGTDGKITYESDGNPLQGSASIEDGPSIDGYTSKDDMYDDVVDQYTNEFNFTKSGL